MSAACSALPAVWSRRPRARLLVVTIFAVAGVTCTVGACASPPPTVTRVATTAPAAACGDVTVTVRGPHDEAAAVVAMVGPACSPLTERGLAPSTPVAITIHGDVDAFVAATGQTVDTLRAWSTRDAVHLLTLASWHRRDDDAIRRRLTHELCHVGLFHRLGEAAHRIPRALGEGLCSVVADQGAERLPLAAVRSRVEAGEAVDFVDDSPFSYGVAHHVVAGIARCRGDGALPGIIDAVAAGQRLGEVLGAPPLSFLGDCPHTPDGTNGGDGVESRR